GDQAGAAPQRLDAGDVLGGEDEVDALAAAPAGEVFEEAHGLVGDRVAGFEEDLELVHDGDDPGPVPVRVGFAELFEFGGLVCLGGLGAAAQLGFEVTQEREPELAVVVDVDADEADVREPGGVLAAGGEAGEGDALFEVEEVERELVGMVGGGEGGDPGVEEVGLARAGGAADERVGRVVAQDDAGGVAGGAFPEGDVEPGRRARGPQPVGEQVDEPGRFPAGAVLLGEGLGGGGDGPGGRGRVEPDGGARQAGVGGGGEAGQAVEVVVGLVVDDDAGDAGADAGATGTGELGAPGGGRGGDAGVGQDGDAPGFGASAGGGGEVGEAGVVACEDVGVDAADVLDERVERLAQAGGADEGEQPGLAEWREPGQGAAEALGVVDVEADGPGGDGAEGAQQQPGQGLGRVGGEAQVVAVEEGDEGGQGRFLLGGAAVDGADAQERGGAFGERGVGDPAVPGRAGGDRRGEARGGGDRGGGGADLLALPGFEGGGAALVDGAALGPFALGLGGGGLGGLPGGSGRGGGALGQEPRFAAGGAQFLGHGGHQSSAPAAHRRPFPSGVRWGRRGSRWSAAAGAGPRAAMST